MSFIDRGNSKHRTRKVGLVWLVQGAERNHCDWMLVSQGESGEDEDDR